MKNDILEFISRRFPEKENWLNGNCYFFAIILNEVFEGKICYDLIYGHFLFREEKSGKYFDVTGEVTNYSDSVIDWLDYNLVDPIHWKRIKENCCK